MSDDRRKPSRRTAPPDRYLRGAATTLLFGADVSSIAQPRGPHATISGEVDQWCYLEGGDRGAAKKECATACAKAGNPIAILDGKGNLYVAAGVKDHRRRRAC